MLRTAEKQIKAHVLTILQENRRRLDSINAKVNPITGEGSVGERKVATISDFPTPTLWLPVEMYDVPLVQQLVTAGSIANFLKSFGTDVTEEAREKVIRQFIRVRCRYDFPFWAALFVVIKAKGGGEDVHFFLNHPQRKLVARLEAMRKAGKPIRLILLKARQWGGSTCIQMYMAWLQLVHKVGLNSLIVALQNTVSDEIRDMYDKMINAYPIEMLYEAGEEYNANEKKFVRVGLTGAIHRVPQRNCKIKIGSTQNPNSVRGGDYNLVHCSEVGLWQNTEKMSPEQMVRSACAGILLKPYTMIVYESTANGAGNFFHREYLAAKKGESQFEALFIPWYDIEHDSLPFADEQERASFAEKLYRERNNEEAPSDREEAGTYLWYLWQSGATLEGINWYVHERTKCTDHADLAAEAPSNDIEAFAFSGRKVFADEDVERFRPSCKPPKWRGEIYGKDDEGAEALMDLRFKKEDNGQLYMWQDVEKDDEEEAVLDRYLVVVDVGKGMSKKADYADILVLDRLYMMSMEPPTVVAEWHGHIDMDKLAWKAAQVAAYYNNALLVIESNTLETNNTKGEAEYILNVIRDVYGDQLYARKQSAEDIKEGAPRKYGFHTNTATKPVLIHNLKKVVREGLYTEREEECLNEYLTYVETDKGGYEAKDGYHDDRLMTRAIGLHICFNEMPVPKVVKKNEYSAISKRKPVTEATIY